MFTLENYHEIEVNFLYQILLSTTSAVLENLS